MIYASGLNYGEKQEEMLEMDQMKYPYTCNTVQITGGESMITAEKKEAFQVEEILEQMTLEEKAQMCSGRDFWKTQDVERLGIPSVMMCDGPNGLRKQLGEGDHLGINESIETVCYPTASAMASSFDRALLRELGEELGWECQAEQVGMLLGPGVNMKRSPLCGRNFEYYSEDPYLAGQLAVSYIQGLQGQGVAACVKHFAANNQETRRMSGSSEVDERTLHEIYLPAFETAVREGKTRGLMCAYNALNGTFCAENRELLTDILRKEWGYEGFVVTDWGAVKDRVKGLESGVDLEMPGSTVGKTEGIIQAVESRLLKEDELDAAVRNVLKFVKDAVENQREDAAFDREAAHRKSGDFAGECAVLLKNESVLPLSKNQKVAFIGEFAKHPRYQGAGSSHIHVEHPVSAMECVEGLPVVYAQGYALSDEACPSDRDRNDGECLQNEVCPSCKNMNDGMCFGQGTEEGSAAEMGEGPEEALLREAVAAAKDAEAAVIFAGLPESYETEGCDREDIRMPENQNRLISEVAKVQKNTVVVLHGGSCMALPWRDEAGAILCMHLGGDQVGRAAVELLYGDMNPSGKLAETWPMKVEDNPSWLNFPGENGVVEYREGIYIGYRYYDKKAMEVQFPFGYGLSYTDFEYRDLKLDRDFMTEKDQVTVSFRVKNIGSRFGKEIVQLYTRVKDSAVRRPVRELKGFEKIALEPGEEKEVRFVLDAKAFSYYEPRIHDWFVECGEVVIETGASSRDIRLSAELKVDSGMELPMTVTRLTTIGELMNCTKGREFVQNFMSRMGIGKKDPGEEQTDSTPGSETSGEREAKNKQTDDAMGAGGEKMRMQMMFEMPLNALVTYGIMEDAALEAIIADMNR